MNYELAKQLKDAGFPQGTHNIVLPMETTTTSTLNISIPDAVVFPTLEELISALGPELFTLQCFDGKWDAIYGENGNVKQVHNAETATIAVAQLWLITR